MSLVLPETNSLVNGKLSGEPKSSAGTLDSMPENPLVTYVRARIEQWLREDESRTASQLAGLAGVTPTTISDLRAGKGGVGMKTLRGLARAWNVTASELERLADKRAPVGERIVYESARTSQWGQLVGWKEAEEVARARYARLGIPDRAWEGARELSGAKPVDVSPESVKAAALFWLEFCDEPRPPPRK